MRDPNELSRNSRKALSYLAHFDRDPMLILNLIGRQQKGVAERGPIRADSADSALFLLGIKHISTTEPNFLTMSTHVLFKAVAHNNVVYSLRQLLDNPFFVVVIAYGLESPLFRCRNRL